MGREADPGRDPSVPASFAAVGIIPARLSSTRLPEKALQDLGGAPLVVRVLERARRASLLRDVLVATDSERIAAAVRAAGARAIPTRQDHETGLDRVAEAARALRDAGEISSGDVIVDIQGDEPFVSLDGIGAMVALLADRDVRIATLAAPFPPGDDPADPDRVKVVTDGQGRALYFSRARIPYGRTGGSAAAVGPAPLLHVGLYALRFDALQELAALPPCELERTERLEQLRALWHGIPIHVAFGDYHSYGVDTAADLERARRTWGERRGSG